MRLPPSPNQKSYVRVRSSYLLTMRSVVLVALFCDLPWLLAVALRVNTHARAQCQAPSGKIFQMWQMQELPQPEVHKRRCVKPTTNGDSAPLVTVTKVAREDICHAGDGSGASLLQARIARTPHTTDVYVPLPLTAKRLQKVTAARPGSQRGKETEASGRCF